MTPRRTALITGASAGIGKALAEVFAENGYDLVLTARRRERLEEIARDLEGKGAGSTIIVADLADPNAPAQLPLAALLAVDGHHQAREGDVRRSS